MGPYNINSLEDILDHKGQNNFNKKQKVIWQAVCWSMLYHIWGARNKRVFENKISNLTTICDEVQLSSFFWVSNRAKGSISSWLDWCADPTQACKR